MNQSIGIDSFKRINPTIDQNTNKRKHTKKTPLIKPQKAKTHTHTQIKRENIKKKIVKGINKFIFFSGLLLNIMLF